MIMKKVAVVIVNWNGKADTVACASSLANVKSTRAQVDVVIVDNGSTDGSVTSFGALRPKPYVIALPENKGFTGGTNAGMRYAYQAGYDYVWLLNNDTRVDTRVVDPLIDAVAGGDAIAGSKIYFEKGREFHGDRYKKTDLGRVLWYAGGVIDWDNMYASHRGVDEVDRGQYDANEQTPFITGCSMFIPREVIARVGYMDDRFYLYLEDVDYSLRVQKAGYRLLYAPASVLWHKNAGSTAKPGHGLHEYYLTRNRLLVGMRYAPIRTKLALIREAARHALKGTPTQKKAVMDAVVGRWGNRYIWKP